ncbi:hypothetical protein TNCV_3519891 [Trichonephila clavipes]|nr:hypothetical protein TNCV_3519891 [Trichonephila clavipes]
MAGVGQELDPSVTEDPSLRPLHVKSVEAQKCSLWRGIGVRRGLRANIVTNDETVEVPCTQSMANSRVYLRSGLATSVRSLPFYAFFKNVYYVTLDESIFYEAALFFVLETFYRVLCLLYMNFLNFFLQERYRKIRFFEETGKNERKVLNRHTTQILLRTSMIGKAVSYLELDINYVKELPALKGILLKFAEVVALTVRLGRGRKPVSEEVETDVATVIVDGSQRTIDKHITDGEEYSL